MLNSDVFVQVIIALPFILCSVCHIAEYIDKSVSKNDKKRDVDTK